MVEIISILALKMDLSNHCLSCQDGIYVDQFSVVSCHFVTQEMLFG